MPELIHRTAIQSVDDPLEFVMSDESVDRYGDVISAAGWELSSFKKNPIALFNHNAMHPVGTWENVRVDKGKLIAKLKLAAEGTSEIVDAARRLLSQRVLRAVSVGFRSLKQEPLSDESDEFWGPFKYLECELVECSLVSVPANPNALQIAKALGLSAAQKSLVFRVPAENDPRALPVPASLASKRSPASRETPMKISEKIKATQQRLVDLRDQLDAFNEKDDDQLTDEEQSLYESLPDEVKALERRLKAHEAAEKALAQANANDPDNGDGEGGERDKQPTTAGRRLYASPKKKGRPADMLVRAAVCHFKGHVLKQSPMAIFQKDYERQEALGWAIRAAIDPAMTNVPEWAQELVQEAVSDYMDLLRPVSAYPQLASQGISIDFGTNGSVRIPGRLPDPNLAGDFIKEGDPIPVRRIGFTSITLTPRKLAVISTFTREMAMHSTPQIETLIRDAMVEDSAAVIDSKLLDDAPADDTRPAGLLAGATEVQPDATESDPLAMMADIKNLAKAVLRNTGGRARNIVYLVNPLDSLSVVTQQTTSGDFMFESLGALGSKLNVSFIESGNVPEKTVIALDAADFATATGATPEFDVSDQATLHMEDTSPQPIVGGDAATPAPAVPTRSLWQTATIGVRMIWDVNWAMRRQGLVAFVQNTTW